MESTENIITASENHEITLQNENKEDDEGNDPLDKTTSVSMSALFQYADKKDWAFIILGLLAAWASGLCMPAMTILFGNLTDALVYHEIPVNESIQALRSGAGMSDGEFQHEIQVFAVGLTIIGTLQLVLSYIFVTCLNSAAERQVYRIRKLFLKCVLKQDIAWYDTHPTGEFASRTSEDLSKLQDGIGEKIGMFNYFMACFIFSVINAFVHGWQLTLVMLSVSPLMVICMAVIGKVQTTLVNKELQAYAIAGNLAAEVLSAIRTVVAFGGEESEGERYTKNLVYARKAGIARGIATATGTGVLWFTIYGSYALAFWYGIKLIYDASYDPSNMITVFFSVLMGVMNMGQSTPYIDAFSEARAAAATIYQIIDRDPPIDSSSEEGLKPEELNGTIEFEDVHFSYPSRPEVKILNGINLKVNKGETVALVGESGCGKSTTIQLLQRFYDPSYGIVKLDGCDIRLLNLGWLRDHIGIVGQEPILFGTTIAENIRYGWDGASQEDIERAAKKANAHNFIMKLPKKYDTLVGDRGAQLSGGQKQRVAIARALIKDPKILLLDEATSALDSESEAVVQEALDQAREGRTTIIIAHRLSTIRNADKIAGFSKGNIVELGTHDELMAKNGIYYTLVTTQTGDDKVNDQQTEVSKILQDEESRKIPMLEYSRTLSRNNSNSIDGIMMGASVLVRASSTSFRRKRYQEPNIPENEDEDNDDQILKPSMMKILRQNADEYIYIIFGCIGALGMGFSIPVFAILFGDIMGVLKISDENEVRKETIKYSCMFLVLGVCAAIFTFLQIFMFSYAGEYLTQRLRKQSFSVMLKQEMAWFDKPQNSVGALCTRLSSDASSVQGATGSNIGTIIQSICTLGASIIISLVFCWQLALVTMCFIPAVLIVAYLHGKMMQGRFMSSMASLDDANKIAIEAISNIRTVAALHKEKKFREIYEDKLKGPHKESLRSTHIRGIVFGLAQSIPFFSYAAAMYYGGTLILKGTVGYEDVFKVAELLIMGTMMVGQAFSFAPNASKGVISAARIFQLLERKPLIDTEAEGLQLPETTPGLIQFKGVKFQYPTRPTVPVLRDFNLTIEPGQVVALVGSSGCGKSTSIQLLERFYDPVDGIVEMDSNNLRDLNTKWLRSCMGIVSQEPILFDRSIAENIAYGDNSRQVGMEEIIQAAMNGNIHNFISSLPQGYETTVGDMGTQLSGGQKQRIAIARALLRNPKILLLDEATSALDTESEKVVQEALDRAQKGRTCITVAHRLSTIRDADQIVVIHQGVVVEKGSHDELLAKQGHYHRFYMTQSKGRT